MSHNLGWASGQAAPPLLKSCIVQVLEELTGIIVMPRDHNSLHKYVQQRMQTLGLKSEAQYCDRIRASYRSRRKTDEWDQLIHQVTNGESYFFRDLDQLTLISETLLPTVD